MQTAVLISVYLAASIPVWLGVVSYLVHGTRESISSLVAWTTRSVRSESSALQRPELVLVAE